VIAAVNGFCLAGGTEILQGTDIRIAVPEAVFGLPEVKWALFPAAGSTVHLPRQISYCRAMELLLLGEPVSAQEALDMGLINRIVPREELMTTAMSIAEKLCANGPLALKAIKESVLRSYDIPREHAYFLETLLADRVFGSRDSREGPKAFVDKRKPVYKGR
jgi:enoyl-CoA hydratase